jgi:hypothetical protein
MFVIVLSATRRLRLSVNVVTEAGECAGILLDHASIGNHQSNLLHALNVKVLARYNAKDEMLARNLAGMP